MWQENIRYKSLTLEIGWGFFDFQYTIEMKVAIQGVRGAFHEVAAREYFSGRDIDVVEKMSFEEVLNSVENCENDYGLIAIENTIAGTIHANLNLLRRKEVRICGEIFLRVRQNLAVLPGVKIEELKEVRSHYMAINQTRQFFSLYPHIKLAECADTALGMRQVAESNDRTLGAVGSVLAAQNYGLEIIAPGIETFKKNYTRFMVVKNAMDSGLEVFNKASLNLVLKNKVGSLAQILSVMSYYNVDLTKVESMPIMGQPMQYMFYVDVKFADQRMYNDMITAIRPLLNKIHILGEYMEGSKSWEKMHND